MFAVARSERLLAQRLAAVARQVSNASLAQLPEYHQRVRVLQALGYLEPSDQMVTMKGRVACEINSGAGVVRWWCSVRRRCGKARRVGLERLPCHACMVLRQHNKANSSLFSAASSPPPPPPNHPSQATSWSRLSSSSEACWRSWRPKRRWPC